MGHLDGVVVVTNIDAKLHLFLTLLRLISLLLLGLLILIFPVVNNTTHRRFRMRSNLDKIKTELLGLSQSFVSWQHHIMLPVYYSDFGGSNPVVHPRPWLTRSSFHGSLSDSELPPKSGC